MFIGEKSGKRINGHKIFSWTNHNPGCFYVVIYKKTAEENFSRKPLVIYL